MTIAAFSSARTCLILILGLFVASGCAGNRLLPADRPETVREIIVGQISFDQNGLPFVSEPLAQRPSQPNDYFTIIHTRENRMVQSYDVAVLAEGPDFTKPFHAVYEWTGRGFRFGMDATLSFTMGFRGSYSGRNAAAAFAVVFMPMTAGTVGGFVVGIGDGVLQAAVELSKIGLSTNEQILTRTVYDYDTRGRLALMRMLTPDKNEELVRTEFVYDGHGERPVRTIVTSIPDGKKTDIR